MEENEMNKTLNEKVNEKVVNGETQKMPNEIIVDIDRNNSNSNEALSSVISDGKSETKNIGEDIKNITNFELSKTTTNFKIALAALVVSIVSLFMPIYNVSILGLNQSISYIEGDGKIILALLLIAIILLLIKRYYLSLIPIAFSLIMYIYFSVGIKSKMKEAMGKSGDIFGNIKIGSFSTGFYLGILSLIVAAIFINNAKIESKRLNNVNE